MPDYVALQQKLNQDSDFRNAFLQAPIDTLLASGLRLSSEQSEALRRLTEQLRAPSDPAEAMNKVLYIAIEQICS